MTTDTRLSAKDIADRIQAGQPVPYVRNLGGAASFRGIDNTIPTRVVSGTANLGRVRWVERKAGEPEIGDVVRVAEERAQTVVVRSDTERPENGVHVLSVLDGVRLTAFDARDQMVASLWTTRKDSRDRGRLADAVRRRGLRWPGDAEPVAVGQPTLERPTCRRAAVGQGAIEAPWWVWGSHGLEGEGQVVLTSDAEADVPSGYAEVRRGETLPVPQALIDNFVDEQRQRALAHGAENSWLVCDARVADSIRAQRNDPSADWHCWVAPVGHGRSESMEAWVSAGEHAITTLHNHVTLRPCEGGWLAFRGLGSMMVAVRTGGPVSGCRFDCREDARAKALQEIRAARRRAMAALELKLDGWAYEAVRARLRPGDTLRTLSGWHGLADVIQIHEPNPEAPSQSSYEVPVVEEVLDRLVPRYASRTEQHNLDGEGARDCTVYELPIVEDNGVRAYWPAVTDVPCPVCEDGTVVWAEAGYVPGYRICNAPGCHQHFMAGGDKDGPVLIQIEGQDWWPYESGAAGDA